MSVTVVNKNLGDKLSNLTVTRTLVTFDSSYPNAGNTMGEPLTHAQLGLNKVAYASARVSTAGAGAVVNVYYDEANQVLHAYTASAQVADGTDLSAVSAQIIAFGTP